MGLLDNIVEKKDIILYIRLRISRLKSEEEKNIHNYPEKNRQNIKNNLLKRRSELDRLLQIINNNKVKIECKKMWKYQLKIKEQSAEEKK